ncbi:hypothetical protein B0H10DRAFT_2214364 [Mycena sp. CBHHK59/15]|nr:hypothetical protein B0H10DRAFT_2214364 [Mycena sp. CBHHK59/15]
MSARIYNEKLSPRDMVFLRYLMQHDYTQKKHHIFIIRADVMLHLGQPTYTMLDYKRRGPSTPAWPSYMLVEWYERYARSPAASADTIPEPHSSHARVPHIVSFLCIHRCPDSADCKHKCHDARSHVTPVFQQTPATNPSTSQPKVVLPSFARGSGSYPATQNTSYPSGTSPAYPSSAGVSFPMPSSVACQGTSSLSACQYSTTPSGTYEP